MLLKLSVISKKVMHNRTRFFDKYFFVLILNYRYVIVAIKTWKYAQKPNQKFLDPEF